MSHAQKTWEVRNQVSTQGTPKVTWLAKYSEWVSWKVPVAGATYTSLIYYCKLTIHLSVQSTVYTIQSTRTVVRVSCISYVRCLYWYTYKCTLYFLRTYEYCVYVRVHVLVLKYTTHVLEIPQSLPKPEVIFIDVRHGSRKKYRQQNIASNISPSNISPVNNLAMQNIVRT